VEGRTFSGGCVVCLVHHIPPIPGRINVDSSLPYHLLTQIHHFDIGLTNLSYAKAFDHLALSPSHYVCPISTVCLDFIRCSNYSL
jgi:hypothetical protein